MEFTKEDFKLENGLKKEWLITNGTGGHVRRDTVESGSL